MTSRRLAAIASSFVVAFLACSSSSSRASAYYLPGTYPREFKRGEHVQVEVGSLFSEQTELPFDYYSLPFCLPPEGIRRSPGAVNPGTLLSGLRQENSPYNLSVKVEMKTQKACRNQPGAVAQGFAPPLDERAAEALASRISQRYRVRMILDNLPIMTFDLEEAEGETEGSSNVSAAAAAAVPGYELGFLDQVASGGGNSVEAFVNNHLELKVLVHRVKARPGFLHGVGESSSSSSSAGSTSSEEEERKRNEALIDAVADLGVRRRQRRNSRSLSQSGETPKGDDDDDRFMIVGFEVTACSIRRDPSSSKPPFADVACAGEELGRKMPPPQRVAVGESIAYTFDVRWEESSIKWASRWDAYLRAPGGKRASRIHWLSLANSLAVALVMASAVAFVTARTVRRDLSRYEAVLTLGRSGGLEAGTASNSSPSRSPYDFKESSAAALEDALSADSGWRNLAGDVWRTPADAAGLAARVGAGAQILLAGTATLTLAAAGLLSPASRGALLTALLGLSLATAAGGGYAAVWLWTSATGSAKGWPRVAWKAGALYPSIAAAVLLPLDVLLWKAGSSGAIPLPALASLAAAWLAVAVPLSLAGGAAAAAARPAADHPTRTDQIPRLVPPPPRLAGGGNSAFSLASPGFLLLASGLLPFCALVFELHFVVSSNFHGSFYYLFGFLFAIAGVAVLLTAQVSVVATYAQLCAEDHRWWGASFARGGAATAAYVGVYCLSAFAASSGLRPLLLGSPLSAVVYLAYTSLSLGALYLALGAVGFAASYAFVTAIYSTVKTD